MGLISNRVERDTLKPGDHIYTWRAAYIYAHHGIYVGENKVIHFTRHGREVGTGTVLDVLLVSSGPSRTHVPCPTCIPPEEGHGVVSSCLDCFLVGGILYQFEYSVNPALFVAKVRGGTCTLAESDPGEKVVHRAKFLLDSGFGFYNLFKNNCEDFAIYCKTGLIVVLQGTKVRGGTCTLAESDPGEKVGHRAKFLDSGFRFYNLFKNNCEDFAIYCKTGLIGVLEGTMGQSGQTVSYVGGPLAAVLSTPLRLVTTNIYGMVVVGVGVYCASRVAADIGMRKDVMKLEVEDLTSRLTIGALQVVDEPEPPCLPPAEPPLPSVS